MEIPETPEIETKYNEENINVDDNIQSKEIICSECKENAFIKIDNYKMNLFGCKNKHCINNKLIKKFKHKK